MVHPKICAKTNRGLLLAVGISGQSMCVMCLLGKFVVPLNLLVVELHVNMCLEVAMLGHLDMSPSHEMLQTAAMKGDIFIESMQLLVRNLNCSVLALMIHSIALMILCNSL